MLKPEDIKCGCPIHKEIKKSMATLGGPSSDKKPGVVNSYPKLITDNDYVPSDEPILKLTSKRCEIIEKHSWVKQLYDQAVDWKKDRDEYHDLISDKNQEAKDAYSEAQKEIREYKSKKDREIEALKSAYNKQLSERGNHIASLEAQLKKAQKEVALLPDKEERLSATHIMVEHHFWEEQKEKVEKLGDRNLRLTAYLRITSGVCAFQSLLLFLHMIKVLP